MDTSKSIPWIRESASGIGGYDVRLIHVIRDPRGWFASQRRRSVDIGPQALSSWCDTNVKICEFAKTAGYRYRAFFYDDLANNPLAEFPRLFAFCGIKFVRSSLEYWKYEHHAFAANGASSLTLSESMKKRVKHLLTGDDAFYGQFNKVWFSDSRWRTELSEELSLAIMNNERVNELLLSFGKRMTKSKLVDVPSILPRLFMRS